MSLSVTQAYKLEKRRAAVSQVYAIVVEIRHNPFNPVYSKMSQIVHTCKWSIFLDLVLDIVPILESYCLLLDIDILSRTILESYGSICQCLKVSSENGRRFFAEHRSGMFWML